MTSKFRPLLIEVLTNPLRIEGLSQIEWDLLIRQAKASNLVAHLSVLLEDAGLLCSVPEAPGRHLHSTRVIAERSRIAVRWEVSQLKEALNSMEVPVVILKGAGYIMANIPLNRGRLFSDIDILVPKASLSAVETRLSQWGWRVIFSSPYDQRYYRTWMHEIPPMVHSKRQTVLDIHHSILPPTAQLQPDSEKLIAAAINEGEGRCIYWLKPIDMFLHSATHLFHEGELEHGLRDILDLDGMSRHFTQRDPLFWDKLLDRAEEMDLLPPLYFAARYLEFLLDSPIPESVKKCLRLKGPGVLMAKVMDSLFRRALLPSHSSCDVIGTAFARWLLYVRSHYLRMPLYLLIPHLIRKAISKSHGGTPAELQKIRDLKARK